MSRRRWIARAQVAAAVLVLLIAALLSGASAAQAERFRHDRPTIADWGRPPVQVAPPGPARYADAGAAWRCGGVLWVAFTSKDWTRVGAGWEQVVVHDDSHVTVQLLERSGRSGPDGTWMSIAEFRLGPVQSAREGYYRWPDLRLAEGSEGGAIVDKARVVRYGAASSPVVIQEGCPT